MIEARSLTVCKGPCQICRLIQAVSLPFHAHHQQMSQSLLGIKIDAVYHTAVVLGGVEYFYGAGVQTCYPGTTHHGRPMEVTTLGKTDLPLDVILEYLESLKQIYTAEVSCTSRRQTTCAQLM